MRPTPRTGVAWDRSDRANSTARLLAGWALLPGASIYEADRGRIDRSFGRSVRLERVPGHVDTDRDLILDGHGEERWTVNFEIGTGERDSSNDVNSASLLDALQWDLRIVSGLAGELDFEIGVNPL